MLENLKFEAVVEALHLSLKEVKSNMKLNMDTCEFYLSFLVNQAEHLTKNGNLGDFNLLFALMVYGIVLFPYKESFVSLAAICIFMSKNPVPTLLADTYYTIQSKYGKKWNVSLCHPMLYRWLMLHLLVSGLFVSTKDYLQWASRIVNLNSFDF